MSGIKPNVKNKYSISSKTQALSPYLFLAFAIFSFFSILSFQEASPDLYRNLFGRLGHIYSYLSFYVFGRASYVIPIHSLIFGLITFKKKNPTNINFFLSLFAFVLSSSIFCSIFETQITSLKSGGGFVGYKFSEGFEFIFGSPGRFMITFGIFTYGVLIVFKEFPNEVNKDFLIKKWNQFLKEFPIREKIDSYIQSLKPKEEEKLENLSEEKIPEFEEQRRKTNFEETYSSVDKMDESEFIVKTITPKFKEELHYIKKEPLYKEEITSATIPKFKPAAEGIVSKIHKQNFSPEITVTNIETFISTTPEKISEKVVFKNEEAILDAIPTKAEEPVSSLPGIMDAEFLDDEIVKVENEEEDILEITNIENKVNNNEKDLFGNDLAHLEKKSNESISKTSTVPDIIPKKNTEYYISHRVLARKTEKKSDPLFKLEAEHTAKKIEEIIKEYGYESRIFSYQKGPIITRFELIPPTGVKLGRITSLTDELKLNLAVKSIRMVAPIPGKSTIGIEVPNKQRDDVFLADILKEQSALTDNKDLTIVIGKDSITGETISIDLNKLPHLLVAGTTGSGKSVSMNSMISSLIFTKSPEDVRFVMIDPKMVEMALYEDIPHLLFPVITDPRKATKALAWAVAEMEIRYNSVSELKCRDLKSYNEKVAHGFKYSKKRYRHMPYIVIFIDELSDLMMVSGKELEDYITRISQKSRAVGIHLVMATQRPSVDVITGLIKANCPARIAFHVAQKTDSKIILDYMGADALLGKGDFLYKSPTSPDLQRIQAPYISEDEIEEIVGYARKYSDPEYVDISLEEDSAQEEIDPEDEEYFEEAWNIVRSERKASASYLQRRMRIGYNKAARLMELMEERGYVGPQIGSKAREILR